MRNPKDTKPVAPESLTECQCGHGRAHLRCDCPLISDENEFSDSPITLVDLFTETEPA